MKASENKLLDFLRSSPQFVVPIYQRTYSWTERECSQLWKDIMLAGADDGISAHFVGSIVYIEAGLYQVSSQSSLLVIDGQQRLTTVMLLLEALARRLGDSEPVDGFSAVKLRSYYLLNPLESAERRFKLLLTETDKESLLALVQEKDLPAGESLRIAENFQYFQGLIKDLGGEVSSLCRGLAKLVMVDISLSRDQDNPQLIFESMNSTGRDLSQADLIRNYLLMGLEPEHQTRLYREHWRPMEVAFGQEAYVSDFDRFMRHYLTFRTGEIPNLRAVYDGFKVYSRKPELAAGGVDALVSDIHRFAMYYCAMALGKEQDEGLADAFGDLRELKVDVAYPFLLELYHDYANNCLSLDDFLAAVRLVEAYVFRRAVCSIPTNSQNKTFATLGRSIDKERYLESIEAQLIALPSYRRFPSNDEFMREIRVRDLYNFPRRTYWLRRLENAGRKERVLVDGYTIEHILPQNERLSADWREALGTDWQRIRRDWLHTIGNLTLTGYNAEYSDHPFVTKRDMAGGFRESPLRLNEGLGMVEQWNESAIQQRADRLASLASDVWSAPAVVMELSEQRGAVTGEVSGYDIAHFLHLEDGKPARVLFEVFRKHVLELDPCVTEEFLKVYVAYKAETNFVDVVPQGDRLQLTLNLGFHEIHDSRRLATDVTNVGRWGNGNVGVVLSRLDELPYVMDLIRQAFERQMGEWDGFGMDRLYVGSGVAS